MSNSDIASALDRWAPTVGGPPRSAYAAGANAAVQFRASADFPVYVSVLATGALADGAHIVFGDADVAAPTVADPLFCLEVGYQDVIAPKGATHYRVFGEGSGGHVYIMASGR